MHVHITHTVVLIKRIIIKIDWKKNVSFTFTENTQFTFIGIITVNFGKFKNDLCLKTFSTTADSQYIINPTII